MAVVGVAVVGTQGWGSGRKQGVRVEAAAMQGAAVGHCACYTLDRSQQTWHTSPASVQSSLMSPECGWVYACAIVYHLILTLESTLNDYRVK